MFLGIQDPRITVCLCVCNSHWSEPWRENFWFQKWKDWSIGSTVHSYITEKEILFTIHFWYLYFAEISSIMNTWHLLNVWCRGFKLSADKADPILLHPGGVPVLPDQQLVHVVWVLLWYRAKHTDQGHRQTQKQHSSNTDNAHKCYGFFLVGNVDIMHRPKGCVLKFNITKVGSVEVGKSHGVWVEVRWYVNPVTEVGQWWHTLVKWSQRWSRHFRVFSFSK